MHRCFKCETGRNHIFHDDGTRNKHHVGIDVPSLFQPTKNATYLMPLEDFVPSIELDAKRTMPHLVTLFLLGVGYTLVALFIAWMLSLKWNADGWKETESD